MEVLKEGKGKLFRGPDPFGFRAARRSFNRGQREKLTTVSEAVQRYVVDGCYFSCGGFGSDRIGTAVLHEIVRQRKKNLSFAGHTSTHDYQILVAGGCIARVDVSYIVGLEARGMSACARRAHQRGEIETTEWSNQSLACRLAAGATGVPFMATYVNAGTDTFEYSAAKIVECPFTGEPIVVVPALNPDVAVIHVHRADAMGNSQIVGITVSDQNLAAASKHVIVTCEELVPTDYFREDPGRTTIPWIQVDAVIEVPYGSYPANMPGCYASDERHLRQWLDAEKDEDEFKVFLEEHVYGTRDFEEYLSRCGGLARIAELRAAELSMKDAKQ